MSEDKIKKYIREAEVPPRLLPENICMVLKSQHPETKKKKIKCISRSVAALVACVLIVFGTMKMLPDKNSTGKLLEKTEQNEKAYFMNHADSYDEIYKQLKKNYKKEQTRSSLRNIFGGIFGGSKIYEDMKVAENGVMNEADQSSEAYTTGAAENGAESDYSKTITQSENVDEADMIKTDGKNVYYTIDQNLYWFSVNNGIFEKTSHYNIASDAGLYSDYNPNDTYSYQIYMDSVSGMYLSDGKLSVVFSDYASSKTYVNVYDTSDSGLSLSQTYSQDGQFVDSRMIENNIYIITNDTSENISNIDGKKDIEAYIPGYTCNGKSKILKPDDIYVPGEWNNTYYMTYAVVGSIDVSEQVKNADVKAFANCGSNVYCTSENLYITADRSDNSQQYTAITRMSLEDGTVTPSASAEVEGYVLNQFSMDEYNGYFRIATTSESYTSNGEYWTDVVISQKSNNLFVLDENLQITGSLTGYGRDESIKSVNFQGDTAYVVTYRQTDPLFAIDLTDPVSPAITDEFKINGFSTFLHRWGDDLLLGFGIDADDQGIETGVKVTMFGTGDTLTENDTYAISDPSLNSYIYSLAAQDRKALLIDSDKNIIGFPVSEYSYNYNENYDYSYNYSEYYVFLKYENGKFSELGRITDSENNTENMRQFSFTRALFIGDYLYAFSSEKAISCKTDNFDLQTTLTLEK